ncbi:RHS repeat-associated core domain-containing protein [Streptomyces subrutilus]
MYSYDADGQMTSRTDAAGATAYTYDAGGRLDTTTDPLTGTQLRSDYDAAGRPTVEQYARSAGGGTYTIGAQRSFGYDAMGRLTDDSIKNAGTGAGVQGSAYEYDLDDRLVKKTATGTAGASAETYAYDLAGRMTSETSGGTTTALEWDKAGNLTKKGDTTATYDSRNRVQTWGTQTFGYSARGTVQTVTDGGTTRTIKNDAFERTIGNGTSSFTYDSRDRVLTNGSTTFTYDGASNNLVKDATSTYSRTPDGTLLASATTGTAGSERLAVTDGHTDLIASLTADGTAVSSSRAYGAFGNVTESAGSNPSLGYQSGWTDSATGEVNMASRWYQPGIGGFTSRDTWQLDPNPSIQANRYTYGNGSPLNGIDPTGHLVQDCIKTGRNKLGWLKFSASSLCVFWEVFTAESNSTGSGNRCGDMRFSQYLCPGYVEPKPRTDCMLMPWQVKCRGDGPWAPPSSGSSSSPSYTSGSSGGGSRSYSGGPSRSRGTTRAPVRPTKPPKPPIDTNAYNGPHPIPAPNLPPAAINGVSGSTATLSATQSITAAFASQAILDILAVVGFTPQQVAGPQGVPSVDTGTGSDTREGQDCRVMGAGWVHYSPTDPNNGDRATGAEACLDQAYISQKSGTPPRVDQVAPPAYTWAAGYELVTGSW